MKLNKKVLAIILGVILLIIVGVVLFFALGNKKNKIDEKELENLNAYSNYFEYLNSNKSKNAKIIEYTLVYDFNEHNYETITIDQLKQSVKEKFNLKLKDEKLKEIANDVISDKISYNESTSEFTYNDKSKKNDIVKTNIYKFINKSTKSIKNGYKLTYDVYTINSPFDLLNEYSNTKNINDVKDINNYINGKQSVYKIKSYITEDIAKKIGTPNKEFIISYVKDKNNYYLEIE